jgi:hypothetical protein
MFIGKCACVLIQIKKPEALMNVNVNKSLRSWYVTIELMLKKKRAALCCLNGIRKSFVINQHHYGFNSPTNGVIKFHYL